MRESIGKPILSVNRISDQHRNENMWMKSFGDRLRHARLEAGLSQRALANKVGLSQSTISDAENGEHAGSTSTAGLAEALGVSPLWLAEGRGPMRPESPPNDALAEGIAILKSLSAEKLGLVLPLLRELHRGTGSAPTTNEGARPNPGKTADPYGQSISAAKRLLLDDIEEKNQHESKGHRVSKPK